MGEQMLAPRVSLCPRIDTLRRRVAERDSVGTFNRVCLHRASFTAEAPRTQRLPALAQRLPALAQRVPALAQRLPALAQKVPALALHGPALAQRDSALARKTPSLARKISAPAQSVTHLTFEVPRLARCRGFC